VGITAVEDLMEEALQQEAESRVGKTLRDKWHLDALLGVGGMAAVYAATHRNGMRGAVKILHPSQARDEAVKARFLREGYLANKVDHAGAVRVLDDDATADGAVFLVMELLVGATLKSRAMRRGGTLPARTLMLAIDQVLDVLAAAHDKGIVHRDLKPENVFLTSAGVVKVLDYGIAGLCDAHRNSARATRTGHAMGTPAFMSPEQARGRWELVDGRSDLWSTGATMYELLVGRPVHDEGTASEIIAATFMRQARSLAEVHCPERPPKALVGVVDRALRLEREERWPDARAMQAALRDAYQEAFGEPLPPPVAPEVSSRASSADLLSVPTPAEALLPMAGARESSEEVPMAVAHRTLGEHEPNAGATKGRQHRVAAIVIGIAALSASVLVLVMVHAGHGRERPRGAATATSGIEGGAPPSMASPSAGSFGPTPQSTGAALPLLPQASAPGSPPASPTPSSLRRPVPRATGTPRPPSPERPPPPPTATADPFDRRL
jgi:serine/threonine protein kinase